MIFLIDILLKISYQSKKTENLPLEKVLNNNKITGEKL